MICKNCGLDTQPGPVCSHCGAALSQSNDRAAEAQPASVPGATAASGAQRKVPVPGVVPRAGRQAQASGYVPVPRGPASVNTQAEAVVAAAAAPIASVSVQATATGHVEESLPIKEAVPTARKLEEPSIAAPAVVENEPVEPRGTMFPPVSAVQQNAAAKPVEAPRKRVHVDDLEIDEVKIHRSPAVGLAMYVGIMVPVLGLLAAVGHFLPAVYVIGWIAAQFAGGLLLPLLRVTPFSDEDSDDIALAVVLTFLFGPAAGFVIYLLIGLLKQNINASIAGCLFVATLCRITVDVARPQAGAMNIVHVLMYTMPFTPIHNAEHLALGWPLIRTLLLDWMSLVTLLGWIAAVMFRKLDE